MDTTFISQPWLLLFVAAILALHIVTFFIPMLRLPLTVLNVLVHTAAAAALIMAGGTLYEFVLLLLVSSFTSMLLGKMEEKRK